MEEKTKVGIVRRPRKEVQGCVQAMEVNKKVKVQSEDTKLKYRITGETMVIAIEEKEVKGGENSIVKIPKKQKVDFQLFMVIPLLM